jgi:hypothetical protein
MTTTDTRNRAYAAGAAVTRDRLAAEDPDADAALRAVRASDIVVVPGCYDHVEQVLEALALPHTRLPADALARADLRPEQLLIVNCPGNVPPQAIRTIRRFVERGGSLFSTDWALKHVVEPAFPGVLAYNDRPTADDVVRVEVRDKDNQFLRGVMDAGDDPQWWLEASSYPIRVLDPDRAEVLVTSREMAERYGEAAIAVLVRWGDGDVFHMVSHYYLQRTELRSARQSAPASTYFESKGVAAPAVPMSGLAYGDIESAASSARLFANVVAAKKRRGR